MANSRASSYRNAAAGYSVRSAAASMLFLDLLKQLRAPGQRIPDRDVLRAYRFTGAAFDAFDRMIPPMTADEPFFLSLGELHVLIQRMHVHRSERAGDPDLLRTDLGAVIAIRTGNQRDPRQSGARFVYNCPLIIRQA